MAGVRGETDSQAVRRRMEELGLRRRRVVAVGVLLLGEGLGLAVAGALGFTSLALSALGPWETPVGAGFLALGGLALVAAVGFLSLWPVAWLLAMGLQGLSLAVALALYFYLSEEPGYLYAVMAYFILMVFYLNSHGVRTAFQARQMDSGGDEP